MQEYEKNASRDFFEALVQGGTDLEEIYRRADRLGMDIVAEAYNILLFTTDTTENACGTGEKPRDWEEQVHRRLDNCFLNHPDAMLFRYQVFCYAILIKGQKDSIQEKTRDCVETLREIMEGSGRAPDWFVAAGKCVERLSNISQCYYTATRAFAFRYLYDGHILRYEDLEEREGDRDAGVRESQNLYLGNVDINALNPAILQKFLASGLMDEVGSFVQDYFYAIGKEPMESMVFRNYVVLNVRFSVLSFLKGLGGGGQTALEEDLGKVVEETGRSTEAAIQYAQRIIQEAIAIRDENAGNQSRSILKMAVAYMESNYRDEELSMNKVARVANVSANHFSAMFSQNMGQTFTEYLTALRMDKAKELLRCTSKRSSEIAGEVGYKDAHYFSYLFKKTQGMTPSEYRKAGEEG
ncbi:MAG: helix-turn-helix domain-containing protein [Eubacteriales bacterium]|nr:helix-turn-helix domain-containing protein [Eubacteriales bacterium]